MKQGLATLVLAGAAMALTACSSFASADGNDSIGGPPKSLSVNQAMRFDGDGPIRVRGALVAQGGGVVMCDALAESYPPQCVNGVALTGFDVDTMPPGTGQANGVRWVDSIELIVDRDGGTLRAADDTMR